MEIKEKSLNRNEFIYIVAFTLFMITTVYELTACSVFSENVQSRILLIAKLVRYASYLLCMIKLLSETIMDRNKIVLFGVIVVALIVSYVCCKNITYVLYSMLFIGAIDVKADSIIKISIVIQSIFMILSIGLTLSGVVEDVIWDPTTRPRHFLGFNWTTTSAILFVFIILEYIYIKKGRLNIIEYILGILISYWLYKMTDSRMAFLVQTVSLTFFMFFRKFVLEGKVIRKHVGIMSFFPEAIAAVAIGMQYLYNPGNSILSKLNDMLSGRLRLGNEGIKDYGFKLFGTEIEWNGYGTDWVAGTKYNYVDSSYLQIALEYGLIVLCIVLILYSGLMYCSIKNKHYLISWITVFILLFCITEPRLVKPAYNPFLILCITELCVYIKNRRDNSYCEEAEINNN